MGNVEKESSSQYSSPFLVCSDLCPLLSTYYSSSKSTCFSFPFSIHHHHHHPPLHLVHLLTYAFSPCSHRFLSLSSSHQKLLEWLYGLLTVVYSITVLSICTIHFILHTSTSKPTLRHVIHCLPACLDLIDKAKKAQTHKPSSARCR